jgi:hypothetical protein
LFSRTMKRRRLLADSSTVAGNGKRSALRRSLVARAQ